MKKVVILFLCSFLLVACNPGAFPFTNRETIIEWVDFVHVNDKKYESAYTVVIADESYIGERIGEVTFNVSKNVSNPNYRTKNGDAAFWEKGTEIFAVKEHPEMIAIKDDSQINGYRIYTKQDDEYPFHYQAMDQASVTKIEMFEGYSNVALQNTITEKEEIVEFFKILDSGTTKSMFNPDTTNRDPTMYSMVFYQEGTLAYQFPLFYDNKDWYWYPWIHRLFQARLKIL